MAVFEQTGKGKVSYSHRQHTKQETRYEFLLHHATTPTTFIFTRAKIVRWITESMRPFNIVEDRGFKCLMKTERPEHYIPSRVTVTHDMKQVFKTV